MGGKIPLVVEAAFLGGSTAGIADLPHFPGNPPENDYQTVFLPEFSGQLYLQRDKHAIPVFRDFFIIQKEICVIIQPLAQQRDIFFCQVMPF